ncbi:MAG: DUF4190 domain-containing protein [Acidimicrobiia bacterium]
MSDSFSEAFGGRDRPFGETVAPGVASARPSEQGVDGVRAAAQRVQQAGERRDPFGYRGPVPTGGPAPGYVSTVMPRAMLVAPPRSDSFCTAAVVLGVLSLPLFFLGVVGVAAVVFGHLGRARVRRQGVAVGGAGAALTGLVLGYLSLALFAVIYLT